MRPRLTAMALVAAVCAAQAQPAQDEAWAIYRQFDETVAATGNWHKKSEQARHQARQHADVLIQRAERLWGTAATGPGAACRAAAIAHKSYVIDLNDYAGIVSGQAQIGTPADLFAPSFKAVGFGEQKAACRAYIDSL
ncbi:MAG: hypothetical protein QM617_09070 [Comamonas sp.]